MQIDEINIQSKVLRLGSIHWDTLKSIRTPGLKAISEDAFIRLKNSIVENGFVQPLYIWHDGLNHYCLDGESRIEALRSLKQDGSPVPEELPALFIQCKDIQEAARLTLIYSAIYSRLQQKGLFDFITEFDLNFKELRETIVLPDFSEDRFIQTYDIEGILDAEEEEVFVDEESVIVSSGDVFQLGEHKVVCGSFTDPNAIKELFDHGAVKGRILSTDPPYNLPTNFFSGIHHKNFAMGAGEMSDDEFAAFLQLIMQTAKDNTVEGAIHFIFMDFRHSWHMCEAARRVYGSPVPKQVCVWNKDLMANGSFYRAKHELCFAFHSGPDSYYWEKDMLDHKGFYKDNHKMVYIFKSGEKAKHLSHLELKDRIRTNVWNYPSATSINNPDRKELENHPTPKPVIMIADSILDTTRPGEVVIDFFLGSGSTLIASESSGRKCYGTEIDPAYVQSIIIRYIRYCQKRGIVATFKHLNGNLTINDFNYEQQGQFINSGKAADHE